MAFCGKCGTKYEDGAKFCPSCGAVVSAASDQPMQQAAPRQSTPVYTAPVVPGTQGQADIRDAQDNKVMAILAYFGPLVLIPIFAAKESRFARYHANQGIILLLLCIVYSIVYSILSSIILAISWRLFSIVSILGTVCGLGITVLAVIGIINAAKGEMKPLPVLGGITILK